MRLPAPPEHRFRTPPPGGWQRGPLPVDGRDLTAHLGCEPGPMIGWLLAELTAADDQTPLTRARALDLAAEKAQDWPGAPRMRFRVRGHAVSRYIERVRPGLAFHEAHREMVALIDAAPFDRRAPAYTGLNARDKIRGGYLLISGEVCFAVADGWVRTVLTAGLAEHTPAGPDPFPDAGTLRDDPCWPDRRYVCDDDGRLQVRTLLDGELVCATGRSTYAAWKALRDVFTARGQAGRFEDGQARFRARRSR